MRISTSWKIVAHNYNEESKQELEVMIIEQHCLNELIEGWSTNMGHVRLA